MSGASPRRKPTFTSLVAFVIIVVTLYVLSPGVLVVAANHGYLLEEGSSVSDALDVIWMPISWSVERVDWVRAFYDWYLELLIDPDERFDPGPDREVAPLI